MKPTLFIRVFIHGVDIYNLYPTLIYIHINYDYFKERVH